ncbi:MAG TPA: tRNA (guanine-N1)-methyltransferase, partial [Bacteroidetes bacterium]|nr:tRNA (guanine-N1)-methyltransferase [Bacteroidota bacterium]
MREKKPKSYKELVSMPEKLKEKLPTSYDVVGDIILIKLDNALLEHKNEIGNSLLNIHKNVKTVCLIEPVSGEYRTRNVEVIAGENKTETVHKEYGLKFYVDVEKTYFSPRLANERMRITKLVKKDEIIADMFTGVAPFPIMIAKKSNPKIIYGIDKNKYAIEYAKKNVVANNLLDKIELICRDSKNVKKIVREKNADRIIMNHPT